MLSDSHTNFKTGITPTFQDMLVKKKAMTRDEYKKHDEVLAKFIESNKITPYLADRLLEVNDEDYMDFYGNGLPVDKTKLKKKEKKGEEKERKTIF